MPEQSNDYRVVVFGAGNLFFVCCNSLKHFPNIQTVKSVNRERRLFKNIRNLFTNRLKLWLENQRTILLGAAYV